MGCRSEMENEFYELIRKRAGFVDIASPNFVWKSSKPYCYDRCTDSYFP